MFNTRFSFNTREKHGWIGKVYLIKKDVKTGKVISHKLLFNRLMNNALDEIIKSLYGTGETDLILKHIAFGDDNTANNDTMETLGNERYRVPVLSGLRTGTGICQSTGIMLDTEPEHMSGAIVIKEIGFFTGASSLNWNDGGGKDTGLMISRLVISAESKSATQQVNVVREDEFTRG